ncbi:hypothetical protein [Chryseobacterium sp. RU33C]|uniref:hypothetical protein n=1 Tax=Chryseobacterium sp. RU33C TaxID=1907398 RepID=UPI000956BD86|nr:hypothetical protein [Chryseobacterium sp. RU33C]SIR55639.1 Leucine rich repeat-containing protein [Chryseobacterium sp. RU33C]
MITDEQEPKSTLTKIKERIQNALEQKGDSGRTLDLSHLDLNSWDLLYAMPLIEKIPGLTELDLSNNKLTKVTNLIGNLKLKSLKLDRNEIEELPEVGFSKLENLEKLDVSHNKLYFIPPRIGNLLTLKDLNVSNNRLLLLENISKYEKLERLVSNDNQLKYLPEEFFRLSNLTELNLDGNPIQYIPETFSLDNLVNLRRLDFSNKRLSNESKKTIKRIKDTINKIEEKSNNTLKTLYPNDKDLEEIRRKIENPDLGSVTITKGDKIVEKFSKNVVYEFLSKLPFDIPQERNFYRLPARNQLMKMINDDPNLIELRNRTLKEVTRTLADGTIRSYLYNVLNDKRKLYPVSKLPIESAQLLTQPHAESQVTGSTSSASPSQPQTVAPGTGSTSSVSPSQGQPEVSGNINSLPHMTSPQNQLQEGVGTSSALPASALSQSQIVGVENNRNRQMVDAQTQTESQGKESALPVVGVENNRNRQMVDAQTQTESQGKESALPASAPSQLQPKAESTENRNHHMLVDELELFSNIERMEVSFNKLLDLPEGLELSNNLEQLDFSNNPSSNKSERTIKDITGTINLTDERNGTPHEVSISLAKGGIEDYSANVDAKRRNLNSISELPIESAQLPPQPKAESTENRNHHMLVDELELFSNIERMEVSFNKLLDLPEGLELSNNLEQLDFSNNPSSNKSERTIKDITGTINLTDERNGTPHEVSISLAKGGIEDYSANVDAKRRNLNSISELPIESAQLPPQPHAGSTEDHQMPITQTQTAGGKNGELLQMTSAQNQFQKVAGTGSTSSASQSQAQAGSAENKDHHMAITQTQTRAQVTGLTSSVSPSQPEIESQGRESALSSFPPSQSQKGGGENKSLLQMTSTQNQLLTAAGKGSTSSASPSSSQPQTGKLGIKEELDSSPSSPKRPRF